MKIPAVFCALLTAVALTHSAVAGGFGGKVSVLMAEEVSVFGITYGVDLHVSTPDSYEGAIDDLGKCKTPILRVSPEYGFWVNMFGSEIDERRDTMTAVFELLTLSTPFEVDVSYLGPHGLIEFGTCKFRSSWVEIHSLSNPTALKNGD